MAFHSARGSRSKSRQRLGAVSTEIPILEFEHESDSDPDINLRPILPTFKSNDDILSQMNEHEIDTDFKQRFNKDIEFIPFKMNTKKQKPHTLKNLGDSSEDVETENETDDEASDDNRGRRRSIQRRKYQEEEDNFNPFKDTELESIRLEPLVTPSSIPLRGGGNDIELTPMNSTAQLHPFMSTESNLEDGILNQDHETKKSRMFKLPKVSFLPSLSNVIHRNFDPNADSVGDSLGKIRRGNQNDIELGGNFNKDLFNNEYDDYDYMQPADNSHYKMGITGSLMKLWEESNDQKPQRENHRLDLNKLERDQSEFIDTLHVIDNPKTIKKEMERERRGRGNKHWRTLTKSISRDHSRDRSKSRNRSIYSHSKNSAIQIVKSIGSSNRTADIDQANEIPMPINNETIDESNIRRLPSFHMSDPTTEHKFNRQRAKSEHMARITVHISDVLTRQKFLLMLCKAFMLFGAPNHRLEEYMSLTARVLEIEASFLYFPGIMLASFGDPVMRTSDMKLIRVGQGLDLGKLDEAHEIYDLVIHDRLGVEEACERLNILLTRKPYFNTILLILFYGINSAFIIIWFGGSWVDMGPSAAMGMLVGFLQLVVAPRNTMYSSVFEVGSCILISFIGRALGSIRLHSGGNELFCYPAITLSGLSMILPGYIILSGALEIQARSIVSGSVRMFYAIIYSLFMGFGMTLGSGIYGWIDSNATMRASCESNLPAAMNFLFIPMFAITMGFACQASLKQIPLMVIIACAGYTVDYFSALHLPMTQFNAAMGAFTIGVLSNFYSKFGRRYSLLKRATYCETAFTSMLVGIFCLVPGGVAGRNVLASGLGILQESSKDDVQELVSSSTLTFGIMMIEVAIGITVGLFLAALVVYPFGKKRTGLFSL